MLNQVLSISPWRVTFHLCYYICWEFSFFSRFFFSYLLYILSVSNLDRLPKQLGTLHLEEQDSCVEFAWRENQSVLKSNFCVTQRVKTTAVWAGRTASAECSWDHGLSLAFIPIGLLQMAEILILRCHSSVISHTCSQEKYSKIILSWRELWF